MPAKIGRRMISIGIGIGTAIALVSNSAVGSDCVVTTLRENLSHPLPPAPSVSIENLASEIAARRSRVPEFKFIKKEAEKRGLRVWLFGGTASAYGHYVKWDLLREAGDVRFDKSRFDYDYTNIFRSTQDLDIVLDGTSKQAQEFQEALKAQFPYFIGSKATPWEVRSLKESAGDKGAILDDFGFMNQHTDSNSTGMIELTDPPKDESVVRDLRDWTSAKNSQFLKDVHEGKLTYYFSPTHGKTQRAQEGKNPAIFSVVRALTKAFQYDLKIRDEDLSVMKREIDQFDPLRDLRSADAQRWIEKNGKKLYQHAINLEYASQTLQKLGLKQKLIAIKNNPREQDSLAWWMNKVPLKSAPVGEGSGRTAKELGLTEVAHETNHFLAYESITRAHTGEPNVLISRSDEVGETAALGNGFYTKIGKKGAAGTGITIRFEVDPNAREGKDFTLAEAYGFVIWHNKNAIRVIPESLEMSPSQYFEFLAEGSRISADDKALVWKLKRKIEHAFASNLADPNELKKIRTLVMEKMDAQAPNHELLFNEWVRLEGARVGMSSPEAEQLLQAIKNKVDWVVDPGRVINGINRLVQGTEAEAWAKQKFIPLIMSGIKPDVGDRAIINALASEHPVLRDFGLRALKYAEENRPGDRIRMIRKLVGETPHGPIDRKKADAWIRADLRGNSALPIFEALAQKDPVAFDLVKESRAESFEFQKFEIHPNKPVLGSTQAPLWKNFLNLGKKPQAPKKIQLGSPESESGRAYHETIREGTLTESFEMQSTPVTQLQWTMVMGENPSTQKWGRKFLHGGLLSPNAPVDSVSWNDAQEFIKKLNQLDPRYHYRLPTEAEWEFAARAGTKTAYSFGDSESDLSQYGWHSDNSRGLDVHDVASLKPNPAGLYDMHGYVREWVSDVYQVVGDVPPEVSSRSYRVLRGASRVDPARFSRSASRSSLEPDKADSFVGFRLVRTPKK